MTLDTSTALLIAVAAFVVTLAGTRLFHAFAVRKRIVANPNFRSLHEHPKARAGGLVFAFVFVSVIGLMWWMGAADSSLLQLLVTGGLAATVFGFIDDTMQVGAPLQLVVQGILAAWALWAAGLQPLVDFAGLPGWMEIGISWLAFVWLMNLYNFMDGIDGMAASGALFLSVGAMVLLASGGRDNLLVVFGLLATCVAAFLVFNWPPATLFMGTAGSLWLGYCFCALIARTVPARDLSVWTWLVLFGYFAGDTTTTTLLRLWVTPRWCGEHRSHAYQNLARIGGSHVRVVGGVLLYQVAWLLPLAWWSNHTPSVGPIAAALAFGPVILWTFRYGPLLSSS